MFVDAGRSEAGVCVFDEKLIAVGGCDSWNTMNTIEVYDPVVNKWVFLPPMAANRRGAGASLFNGTHYSICPQTIAQVLNICC